MKDQFDKVTPVKEMVERLCEKEFEIEIPTECYHENNLKEATECNDLTRIIDEIKKGIESKTSNFVCIVDRVMAINYVLNELNAGDVAVIAGKGAENYLDISGKKVPYSDFETVEQESKKIFNEAQKC